MSGGHLSHLTGAGAAKQFQNYRQNRDGRKGLAVAQPKSMFNAKGTGTSVWTGDGVTRTKPSRTLFVTRVPDFGALDQLRQEFEQVT